MIIGGFVNLRAVDINDAEFILSLRCNEEKAKFLNVTEYNLKKQQEYIEKISKKEQEWYFIIERKNLEKIGTYRIYDVREESFCIGSWLMLDGVTSQEVIESDYLLRTYGFNTLKMDKIHFDVRKGNKKVISYHKLMGARIVGETELDYLFECTQNDFLQCYKNFKFSL